MSRSNQPPSVSPEAGTITRRDQRGFHATPGTDPMTTLTQQPRQPPRDHDDGEMSLGCRGNCLLSTALGMLLIARRCDVDGKRS